MKPILFSTPMVQAILDGRKTMTRRVIKIPYPHDEHCEEQDISIFLGAVGCKTCGCYHWDDAIKQKYQVGDVLWVRETWARIDELGYEVKDREPIKSDCIMYKTDFNADEVKKWKPSIFMPKEAARIFLRVTNVRVERLQDITGDGIEKEGLPKEIKYYTAALEWWKDLWNSINGKGAWEENPFVFVYEFQRIEKPC